MQIITVDGVVHILRCKSGSLSVVEQDQFLNGFRFLAALQELHCILYGDLSAFHESGVVCGSAVCSCSISSSTITSLAEIILLVRIYQYASPFTFVSGSIMPRSRLFCSTSAQIASASSPSGICGMISLLEQYLFSRYLKRRSLSMTDLRYASFTRFRSKHTAL